MPQKSSPLPREIAKGRGAIRAVRERLRDAFIFLLAAAMTAAAIGAEEPVDLARIDAVWRENGRRLQGVKCEIAVARTEAKLPFMSVNEEDENVRLEEEERERLSHEFVTSQMRYDLLMDKGRAKYHLHGARPGPQLKMLDVDYLSSTDGKMSASGSQFNGYPIGTIYSDPDWRGSVILDLKPIQWALRGMESLPNFGGGHAHVRKESEQIAGRTCSVLETQLSDDVLQRLWVAPESEGFRILQYSVLGRGLEQLRVTCKYEMHIEAATIPSAWTIKQFYPDGRTSSESELTVENCEINPRCEGSDFVLTFVPGTFVTDMRQKDEYGHELNYILRPDGTKRVVLWEERDRSYDELLKSDTPLSGTQQRRGKFRGIWIAINVVAIAMLIVGVAVANSRRRASVDRNV